MTDFHLKPTHAPVKAYYEAVERFGRGKFDNEGNIRGAFERLLEHCARKAGWTLVPEYKVARKDQHPAFVDGALVDEFNLPRGYWEAKDSKDDLETEIQKKFRARYPRTNILFQTPARAILYQNGVKALDSDITEPRNLIDVLGLLFGYSEPHIQEWESAVREFADRIPDIAVGAMKLIEAERKSNKAFVERFTAFAEVCRESINPDLKDEAVEKMLVQHLLTERIFRRIFDNLDFSRRNVIAIEIEKVIASLTQKQFSRDQFLRPLDRFYKAIEDAASQISDYSEKQSFLNVVYEKFFQRFDAKQADTHGIVYTPQPIVEFMVRSVEQLLKQEFGRSLSDEGVHILDPFVGTGTFITRIMQEIKKTRIEKKYANELHCNEVMLLPYYIASMNIEHTFLDMTGRYEPFEGICLVDTFELAEPKQAGFEFMTEGNTERIRRQKKAPIFVVIGNPPYNVGQANENDQNKNRKYRHMDARVQETYTRASTATLRNKLSDPYVKAFRWATDRIRAGGGIIAFVTNNSFLDKAAFDGMRSHLAREFTTVMHLNLKGDAHTSGERRRREAGNIFRDQIRVGVGITLLIKNPARSNSQVLIHSIDDYLTADQKTARLIEYRSMAGVPLKPIRPDARNNWLTEGEHSEFEGFQPVGDRKQKSRKDAEAIFSLFSLGIASNRDAWVFNHSAQQVLRNLERTKLEYMRQERIYEDLTSKEREAFAPEIREYDIKWTDRLIDALRSGKELPINQALLRDALFRPFDKQSLYFDSLLIHRRYQQHHLFPTEETESENIAICCSGVGSNKPFHALASNKIASLDLLEKTQCFPFFRYAEDGSNRRENITDWALAEFRSHYGKRSISKWDIFHYVYAVLHHPEYRTRYAANLKRELPRIPFAPDFAHCAAIGKKLMDLHIHYEQQPEYPLDRTEIGQLDWRVRKMKLSKDKSKVIYNDFLTLCGIPPEVYEYRLGNRSALEWVVDQYCVSKDKRSGIVNDPNREDDPEYIVRLIGQVVSVSLETVKLVRELASLPLLPAGSD